MIKFNYCKINGHNCCTMATILRVFYEFLMRRFFLISWISLVIYVFYTTFTFYQTSRQFYYLREILGIGLCISRGTATVLNICCALVLLPLCKKLNQVLYRILSKLWPGLFFFWLEKAKSFHMSVAITLVVFAVIHSISHFANLWNFSRNYDRSRKEINFASYKNENPFFLLMSPAGLTGAAMLVITVSMGLTSLRVVRRRLYNWFWYTHQLYLPFMVLLIVHPLSGVLKRELLPEERLNYDYETNNTYNSSGDSPIFVPIQSTTWIWMVFPLSCFFLDLLWRVLSRNRARVDIIQVAHMAGRTLSLTLGYDNFSCRAGQYVLLQCPDISRLEWHPFTVVKVPTSSQRNFIVWIRVKGDWTKALERLLLQNGPNNLSILVDGPFSSPMEAARRRRVAVCVAAGVGVTPFVALLHHMLLNPRSRLPGRIHLLWIVRHEKELTWVTELATKTLMELRNANKPDRLHLQLYVTSTVQNAPNLNTNKDQISTHVVLLDEKSSLTRVVTNDKATLLTPNIKRRDYLHNDTKGVSEDYSIAKEFPHLACRVRRGRPHWDQLFDSWVHLYPEDHLNLYCCGPKKLVKLLRNKCKQNSRGKTKFTFVHEGFS